MNSLFKKLLHGFKLYLYSRYKLAKSINKQTITIHKKILFQCAHLLLDLIEKTDFKLFIDEDKNLMAKVDDLTFFIQTTEDIYILHEIYYTRQYNIYLPFKCIVIDIGMHVGFASLFFASLPQVLKVYAFEPALPTYEQALRNIALNPAIKEKIQGHNIGLGNAQKTLPVDYVYAWKGSAGLMGITQEMIKSGKDHQVIDFYLEDITHQLQKIIDQHLDTPIVVKIDCEGSEYEIIQRLVDSNMIKKVDLFIIEWHNGLVKDLIASFENYPFIIYYPNPYSLNNGMLVAVKVGKT